MMKCGYDEKLKVTLLLLHKKKSTDLKLQIFFFMQNFLAKKSYEIKECLRNIYLVSLFVMLEVAQSDFYISFCNLV